MSGSVLVRTLREVILSSLLAAIFFMGINTVTARSYVEGQSMEPNLHRGQFLLISRLGMSGLTRQVYADAQPDDELPDTGWAPQRGAIVTLNEPTDPSKVLIKRVVGLPGEVISIREGVVFIDGRPLDEPYVTFKDRSGLSPQRVPIDSVYVLGDNRPGSGDSRQFGPVHRSNLLGLAVLRYWPITDFGWLIGNP